MADALVMKASIAQSTNFVKARAQGFARAD
jgi:hypothetical protein